MQLILHLLGDYVLQSDWMARNKRKLTLPCLAHCLVYTAPFVVLTQSGRALGIIFITHFLIDRFGLARYVVWLKNWMSPNGYVRWSWCRDTGYFAADKGYVDTYDLPEYNQAVAELECPVWMRVWLFIIADNTLHLICNALALAMA